MRNAPISITATQSKCERAAMNKPICIPVRHPWKYGESRKSVIYTPFHRVRLYLVDYRPMILDVVGRR